MADQKSHSQTQSHASSHHHHHHHKKDSATIFKEKSLQAISRNKLVEKWLRIGLVTLAAIMAALVIAAYTIG